MKDTFAALVLLLHVVGVLFKRTANVGNILKPVYWEKNWERM